MCSTAIDGHWRSLSSRMSLDELCLTFNQNEAHFPWEHNTTRIRDKHGIRDTFSKGYVDVLIKLVGDIWEFRTLFEQSNSMIWLLRQRWQVMRNEDGMMKWCVKRPPCWSNMIQIQQTLDVVSHCLSISMNICKSIIVRVELLCCVVLCCMCLIKHMDVIQGCETLTVFAHRMIFKCPFG